MSWPDAVSTSTRYLPATGRLEIGEARVGAEALAAAAQHRRRQDHAGELPAVAPPDVRDGLPHAGRRVDRGVGGQLAPLEHGRRGHHPALHRLHRLQLGDAARRHRAGQEEGRGRHEPAREPDQDQRERRRGQSAGAWARSQPADPSRRKAGASASAAITALASSARIGCTPTSGSATLSAAKMENPSSAWFEPGARVHHPPVDAGRAR